jgi:hypothetical protein
MVMPDAASRLAASQPVSSPSWRWVLATCAARLKRRMSRRLDEHTMKAVRFLRGRPEATVAKAAGIFREDGQPRWILEANVLSGRSVGDIARTLDLHPALVESYEAIFFDVRCRRHAVGWIAQNAFGRGWRFGDGAGDLGSLWRSIAYSKGALLLDLVHAVTTGIGRSRYSAEQIESAGRMVAMLEVIRRMTPAQSLRMDLQMLTDGVRNRRSGPPSAAASVALSAPAPGGFAAEVGERDVVSTATRAAA